MTAVAAPAGWRSPTRSRQRALTLWCVVSATRAAIVSRPPFFHFLKVACGRSQISSWSIALVQAPFPPTTSATMPEAGGGPRSDRAQVAECAVRAERAGAAFTEPHVEPIEGNDGTPASHFRVTSDDTSWDVHVRVKRAIPRSPVRLQADFPPSRVESSPGRSSAHDLPSGKVEVMSDYIGSSSSDPAADPPHPRPQPIAGAASQAPVSPRSGLISSASAPVAGRVFEVWADSTDGCGRRRPDTRVQPCARRGEGDTSRRADCGRMPSSWGR